LEDDVGKCVSRLFEFITIRDVTMSNRAWVSPMCQYSSVDGLPNDWHLMHLGQFAAGGAGLILTEASAVVPEGRISPRDAGIWNDEQVTAWRRITDFIHAQGTKVGMQLAHAGRKGSTLGNNSVPVEEGGWHTVGPSDLAFGAYAAPRALTEAEVAEVPSRFAAGARRAMAAGFDVVELHFAHGYLVHQFLSPLSNDRIDHYGGDFDGRVRLALDIAEAVRAELGDGVPVFARISATDWEGESGWDAEQAVRLAKLLGECGVDLIDVSSGGNTPYPQIPVGPGYQVRFAEQIRTETGIRTGAVGMITEPEQAERILANGQADAVLLGREFLRDPHWPLRAAHVLGAEVTWPVQYARAVPQS
jgi:2,4-dienoyl-CoA reductase-like NADH-dependent reductase (Old Yellow Enzyme family)